MPSAWLSAEIELSTGGWMIIAPSPLLSKQHLVRHHQTRSYPRQVDHGDVASLSCFFQRFCWWSFVLSLSTSEHHVVLYLLAFPSGARMFRTMYLVQSQAAAHHDSATSRTSDIYSSTGRIPGLSTVRKAAKMNKNTPSRAQ